MLGASNLFASGVATSPAEMRSLRLGFNFGYLGDTRYYGAALARTRADNVTAMRGMGPFLRGLLPVPAGTANLISDILGNISAGARLTVALSNFPFDFPPALLSDPTRFLTVWPGMPATDTLADEMRYTNRGPPSVWLNGSLSTYASTLRELRALLGASGARVDFELGNEVNALGYFWGTASEWAPVADAAHAALTAPIGGVVPPTRVACCTFATELGGCGKANGSDNGFYDFARGAARRYPSTAQTATPLSWHFYRRMANDANPNRSTCVHDMEPLRSAVPRIWGSSRRLSSLVTGTRTRRASTARRRSTAR